MEDLWADTISSTIQQLNVWRQDFLQFTAKYSSDHTNPQPSVLRSLFDNAPEKKTVNLPTTADNIRNQGHRQDAIL